eukprot:PhM_4_TR8664/c0_g1_i1/m.20213
MISVKHIVALIVLIIVLMLFTVLRHHNVNGVSSEIEQLSTINIQREVSVEPRQVFVSNNSTSSPSTQSGRSSNVGHLNSFSNKSTLSPSAPSSSTSLRDPLPWCSWSNPNTTFPYKYDIGRAFVNDTYAYMEFLYETMYRKYGVLSAPTAGTALGAARHGGTFSADDDIDVHVFLTSEDVARFDDWQDYYEEFLRRMKAHREDDQNHRFKFFWKPSNHVIDLQKRKVACTKMKGYRDCLRKTKTRTCLDEIRSENEAEKRKMFWGERLANHVTFCVQPHEYTLSNTMWTADSERDIGAFCTCRYGPIRAMCFEKLPQFLDMWYPRGWRKPVGPVRDRGRAGKFKSWND